MFAAFMTNAWIAATLVAVVAGVVGFFVVARSEAFAAHAIPNGAFAGAAAAALVGVNAIVGLATFALLAALGISRLGRRARHDVATALALVVLLALGAAFLSRTTEYAPEIFALLFGQLLGVSSGELVGMAALAAICLLAIASTYRPLLLSSVAPEIAEARGLRSGRMTLLFLLILALATAMTVPVVGTLLVFSLMIGPPAAARSLTARPGLAMALGVGLALLTVWLAIASSYLTNWPVGFFVGALSALVYAAGRLARRWSTFHRGSRAGAVEPSLP
jgi:zinc/manganese transport system permease protein